MPAFRQFPALTDPLIKAGHDDIASFQRYGQAARLSRVLPAADLVRRLLSATRAAFARLR